MQGFLGCKHGCEKDRQQRQPVVYWFAAERQNGNSGLFGFCNIIRRCQQMDTDGAKQLVYRYNGIAQSDEVEVDLNGEKPIPQKDQVIVRNGKQWK
jgi:hypothetical protein